MTANRILTEQQIEGVKKAARSGFEAACAEFNLGPEDFDDYEEVVKDIQGVYLDLMRSAKRVLK